MRAGASRGDDDPFQYDSSATMKQCPPLPNESAPFALSSPFLLTYLTRPYTTPIFIHDHYNRKIERESCIAAGMQ